MARRVHEEVAEKAPLWIMSFGDMVTNLLAFFMIIQSFSKSQESAFFYAGEQGIMVISPFTGSTDRLLGNRSAPNWGNPKATYAAQADESNEFPERLIDPEDDRIRQIFDDLRKTVQTETSAEARERTRLFTTPIAFKPGQAALSPADADFLAVFAGELAQVGMRLDIYVVGLAPDEPDRPAQFILSAKRAEAVRERLATNLPRELLAGGSRVFSWGIGSGREGKHAFAGTRLPSIVIAVTEGQYGE